MKHDEVVSHRGQAVVDNHVQPLVVLPKLRRKTEICRYADLELLFSSIGQICIKNTSPKVSQRQGYLEMKDARISVVKLLVVGDDVGQGVLLEGQGCDCCQKPAVTW